MEHQQQQQPPPPPPRGRAKRKQPQAGSSAPQAQAQRRTQRQPRAQHAQQLQQQQQYQHQQQQQDDSTPLSLASLPPRAVIEYLLHYGLVDPGALSFHNAVFPVRTSYRHITNVAAASSSSSSQSQVQTQEPQLAHAAQADEQEAQDATTGENAERASKRQKTNPRRPPTCEWQWHPPPVPELGTVSALDEPASVRGRLVDRIRTHWDECETIKEGETLTNFLFAVRMRDKVLHATPRG